MGLLHIYCGDGKGKTTAALGLALRAAGSGMNVCFVQLMKGNFTSELNSLKLIPNITVYRLDKNYGFYKSMSSKDKDEIAICHNKLIMKSISCNADMIVLDEFCSAYQYDLVDKGICEKLIFNALKQSEVVITGRNPNDIFIQAADYVSEIKSVKHPYENGITARKGIEF